MVIQNNEIFPNSSLSCRISNISLQTVLYPRILTPVWTLHSDTTGLGFIHLIRGGITLHEPLFSYGESKDAEPVFVGDFSVHKHCDDRCSCVKLKIHISQIQFASCKISGTFLLPGTCKWQVYITFLALYELWGSTCRGHSSYWSTQSFLYSVLLPASARLKNTVSLQWWTERFSPVL